MKKVINFLTSPIGSKKERPSSKSRSNPSSTSGPFKPVGLVADDFLKDESGKTNLEGINTRDELRDKLKGTVPKTMRARVWRLLCGVVPVDPKSEQIALQKKREEYLYLVSQNKIDRFLNSNDSHAVEIHKLIKKDVDRTLTEWRCFRFSKIQESLHRVLFIYSLRNPMSDYSQGMNDLLAPILLVFLLDGLQTTFFIFENNMKDFESKLTNDLIMTAEADAYYVFSHLISLHKRYYVKNFTGVYEGLARLDVLLASKDPSLYAFLKGHGIEVNHFAFRWIYCLLLREFPLFLTTALLDHYFLEQPSADQANVWMALALLLRFSAELQSKSRDEALVFLHKLPTEEWGFRDIESLVHEKTALLKPLCT